MKSANRRLLPRAAVLTLTGVLISGCAKEEVLVPVTNLGPFKTISYSCKDTPVTREQIRAHNGVYMSLKSGKKTVYADDCPAEPQGKPTS